MRVCVDKTCEGVLCEECKDLKPSMCGDRGLQFPKDVCNTIRFEGVDDVEFNQGYCIDLYENVHAYDADGTELPFTVEPSTLDCCEVGKHEFTYTAVGKGNKMLPSFCIGKPMLHTTDCGLMTKVVKRVVSVLQALPPRILGIGHTIIPTGTTFDPLYEVEAIDGNGNPIPEGATYEGRYDVSTSKQNIASFDSDIEQNAKSLKVALEPIQEGSGTPSPDNVRPISGRTEVVTQRTGKNLNPNEGVDYATSTSERFFLKAGQYVFSTDNGAVVDQNNAIYIQLQDEAGNVITKGGITSSWFTLNGSETFYYGGVSAPSRAFVLNFDAYMLIGFNNQKPTNFNALQLELGSTATDYEPYDGNTYTTTLGRTVYGGTLDVVSGELVVDRAMVDMTSITDWNIDRNAKRIYKVLSYIKPNTSGATIPNILSNRFEAISPNSIYANVQGVTVSTGSALQFHIDGLTDNADVTLAEVNQYFIDNPTQVVYELATPQTIQLTPQEVKLLLGTNNVWSEDGKVEVIYSKPLEGVTQLDIKGVYPITYHTEDVCGNETTETRYVIVANCDDDSQEPILCQGRLCCASLTCNYSSTVCEAGACYTLAACEQTEIIPSEA